MYVFIYVFNVVNESGPIKGGLQISSVVVVSACENTNILCLLAAPIIIIILIIMSGAQ